MTTLPATCFDVRAELEERLERDLLGPRDGESEELPPGTPPAEWYLLGRLVPRTRPSEPLPATPDDEAAGEMLDVDLVDRELTDAADTSGEDVETGPALRTGTMAASALGLSFRVPLEVQRVVVTASWGAYATGPSQVHTTERGTPRSVWRRTPAGGQVEVDLTDPDPQPLVVDPEREGVVVRVAARERDGARVVDVSLINDQGVPSGSVDTARTYQSELTVTALDGHAGVFLGHNTLSSVVR